MILTVTCFITFIELVSHFHRRCSARFTIVDVLISGCLNFGILVVSLCFNVRRDVEITICFVFGSCGSFKHHPCC